MGERTDNWNERKVKSESWICPDCGSALKEIPAKDMHPVYSDDAKARGCTNQECNFKCFISQEVTDAQT